MTIMETIKNTKKALRRLANSAMCSKKLRDSDFIIE
jgi:hypothetical protein